MPKMLEHCREKHPDNIIFENKEKLIASNFKKPVNRDCYIIINVFDTLFRFTWDVRGESGDMRFAVYHIGSPLIHKQYSFEISIISRFKNPRVITMKGPCFQLYNDDQGFMWEKYLSAKYSLIKEFCDEDGNLQYSITVLENNADK
ncbi:hypothetical protein JTB14_033344 [Gonioctena quinquepunctata]|nr:hypothetical protein JTB14_033344 [Gonioctena quinquepunctata]